MPPAVQAGRQPGMAFGAGGLSVIVVVVGAVVLDQHVEEPAQVFGAVVAGEGHHGVFAGGQRITDGAVRAADRPDMVDGDGPVGQRGRGLGQHITQRAGGVDPPAGMPRRGAGGCRQPVPVVRCPASCAPPRVSKDARALACTAASCWVRVWTSRIVRCSWSRVHSAGSMANNWSTWQRSPSKAVSGSVAVVVRRLPPLTSNVSTRV